MSDDNVVTELIDLVDEKGRIKTDFIVKQEDIVEPFKDKFVDDKGRILPQFISSNLQDEETKKTPYNVGEMMYDELLDNLSKTDERKLDYYNFKEDPDKNDLQYAEYSKDVYNEIDKRNNIRNRKYSKQDSADKYATYIGDEDIVLAIKGTTPDLNLKDIQLNTAILLGSLGGQQAVTLANFPIQQKLNELRDLYPDKKLKVTGHSQAGALASLLGVDNPDVDVVTFNRELGLPFISSVVKCSIYGCDNISNFKISGDFASASIFDNPQTGNTFTVAPKIPNIETQLEAQSLESIFIPADLYIPHSINNFIDRKKSNLIPDYNIYGRTLARRVGASAGVLGGILAPKILETASDVAQNYYSQLPSTKNVAQDKIFEDIIELGTQGLLDQNDFNLLSSENEEYIAQSLAEKAFEPAENLAESVGRGFGNINKVTSTLVSGGIGSVMGVGIYENLLAGKVEDL